MKSSFLTLLTYYEVQYLRMIFQQTEPLRPPSAIAERSNCWPMIYSNLSARKWPVIIRRIAMPRLREGIRSTKTEVDHSHCPKHRVARKNAPTKNNPNTSRARTWRPSLKDASLQNHWKRLLNTSPTVLNAEKQWPGSRPARTPYIVHPGANAADSAHIVIYCLRHSALNRIYF